MIENDLELYHRTVGEGSVAIYFPKEGAEREEVALSDDSRVLVEKIIAVSAAGIGPDWHGAWTEMADAMSAVTPEAGVRAIREAREIGAIDFEESVRLIEMAIEDEVLAEAQADREYQRMERDRDEMVERLKIDLTLPEAQWPFEYRVVEQAIERRWKAFAATLLRRYGEHRVANLLTIYPEEYERITNG
jgi:hypothetical protein